MSLRRPDPNLDAASHFPEAIAQWRLALRTEVKSTSALPTAIFHSRDAMLETLLAETNEPMLSQLQEPGAHLKTPQAGGEQRIEVVRPEELRALPALLRDDPGHPIAIDDHLTIEVLTVLADTCGNCDAAAVAGAVAMLRNHFGIDADAPTATVVATLLEEIEHRRTGDPAIFAALATWAQRLATAAANIPCGADRGEGDGE